MDIISNLEVTHDLEFDSFYIENMIEKFSLTPILCSKCSDLTQHLMDPEFYTNELYVKNARWVRNKDAVCTMDIPPYNELTLPIYDIANIKVRHPANRIMGKIHLVREVSEVKQRSTFMQAARISSLSALKKLADKPFMSKEIGFKLSEDVNQGVLVKLKDFLQLEEVKKLGID